MTANINLEGLQRELELAGIAVSGCGFHGEELYVCDINNIEIQTRPDVVAVILAHNPQNEVDRQNRIASRLQDAIAYLKQYAWSRTTLDDWATYYNLNLSDAQIDASVAKITTIPTARTELAKMWKLQNAMFDRLTQIEILLRDILKPDNSE